MKGVANIVGFVMLTAILISASYLAYQSAKEQARKMEMLRMIEDVKRQMSEISQAMRELASSSPGSKKTIDLKYPVVADNGSGMIYAVIDSPVMVLPPGVRFAEGDVILSGGTDVLGYENSSHFMLENSVIRISIPKIGSPSSPSPINMSSMIWVENKITGSAFSPGLGVKISDIDVTAGSGYSELVTKGTGLPEGVAKIVATTAQFNYTLFIILPSASDYFLVKVREIRRA